MKRFVEATQEAGFYLTEPSLRATSGQIGKKEAQEYVKKCDQCQRFTPNLHQPGGVLNPLSSPWPFAQWGLDIVGHLQQGTRGICWSALTILLSGLKLSPWQTSKMWMPRSLFGKTLSLGLGSLIH